MRLALEEAKRAFGEGEVPVGAVIVKDGELLCSAHNLRETRGDPLLHAEIIALSDAAKRLGTRRLAGCSLYVTLEPCPMCAGALINSAVDRVVFGAYDKKAGSLGSVCNLFAMPYNHIPVLRGGVLQNDCAELLTAFFVSRRGVPENNC